MTTPLLIAMTAAAASAQQHPRIFFDSADVPDLQERAATTHAHIAAQLQTFADTMVVQHPDPPDNPIDKFPTEGTWRLWGDRLTPVAIAWTIETDQVRRDAYHQWLLTWMDALNSWTQWGPTARTHLDLDGAHLLAGFTIACDIIDTTLDDTRRTSYHDRVAAHASDLTNALDSDPQFWSRNWLGNHNTINHNALLLAGLMLAKEHPEAPDWISRATINTGHVMDLRANRSDGSDLEGVMYATYGDHSLFQTLFLLQQHLDIDHASTSPWIAARAEFYLHGAHPNLTRTLDIGDGLGSWGHGPEHLLYFLDSIAGDGYATALGQAIQEAMVVTHPLGKPQGATLWLSFLWFDPALAGADFPGIGPSLHFFDDWDVAVWHEGWNEGDTVLSFKCGVPPGRSAWNAILGDPSLASQLGCAHANPDAGSFTFKPRGQHFILDSLYERPKRTSINNSITFGPPPIIDRGWDDDEIATVWDLKYLDQLGDLAEIGQVGDWQEWMGPMQALVDANVEAHIVATGHDGDVIYTSGEAAGAYPATIPLADGSTQPLGLNRLHRGLLRLPMDVLLVVDRIVTTDTLPSHTYFRSLATPAFDRQFTLTADGATLLLDDGTLGHVKVITPFAGALTTGRNVCDWDDVHPALHVDDWYDLSHWSIFACFTSPTQEGDTTTVYLLHDDVTAANVTQVDTNDPHGVHLTIQLASGTSDIRIATDMALESRLGFLGIDGYATCRGALFADVCDGSTCPCTGDVDDNGSVGIGDLLLVLGSWGEVASGGADVNGSGTVDVEDLLMVISRWGVCP